MGTRKEAEAELTRQLAAIDAGAFVGRASSRSETLSLAAKTADRYRQLIEKQIVPHLGTKPLEKLRPAHIATSHVILLREGGSDRTPLAPHTVGHAHRVLRKALADAVSRETYPAIQPPSFRHLPSTVKWRSSRPTR